MKNNPQSPQSAQLFICRLPEPLPLQTVVMLTDSLPPARKQKVGGFLNLQDKTLSAAAWHLLRYAVFAEFGVDSFCLPLQCDRLGKPSFCDSDIHFNISHCKAAVACAVGRTPLGVDIESLRKANMRVAERFISDCYNKLVGLQGAERDCLFSKEWCKMESVYKAGFVDGKISDNYHTHEFAMGNYFISLCAAQSEPPKLCEIDFEDLQCFSLPTLQTQSKI